MLSPKRFHKRFHEQGHRDEFVAGYVSNSAATSPSVVPSLAAMADTDIPILMAAKTYSMCAAFAVQFQIPIKSDPSVAFSSSTTILDSLLRFSASVAIAVRQSPAQRQGRI
jgi:hypothetical protein